MQLYPSKKEQKKVVEVSEISPQHPYSDTGRILIPTPSSILCIGAGNLLRRKEILNTYTRAHL